MHKQAIICRMIYRRIWCDGVNGIKESAWRENYAEAKNFVFESLKLRLCCATGCELCVCKHCHCQHMFNIRSERLRWALFNVVFDQLKGATRPPVTDRQELQRGDRNAASNFIPITRHFYQKRGGGGRAFFPLFCLFACWDVMASPVVCTTAKRAGWIVLCIPRWVFTSDVKSCWGAVLVLVIGSDRIQVTNYKHMKSRSNNLWFTYFE